MRSEASFKPQSPSGLFQLQQRPCLQARSFPGCIQICQRFLRRLQGPSKRKVSNRFLKLVIQGVPSAVLAEIFPSCFSIRSISVCFSSARTIGSKSEKRSKLRGNPTSSRRASRKCSAWSAVKLWCHDGQLELASEPLQLRMHKAIPSVGAAVHIVGVLHTTKNTPSGELKKTSSGIETFSASSWVYTVAFEKIRSAIVSGPSSFTNWTAKSQDSARASPMTWSNFAGSKAASLQMARSTKVWRCSFVAKGKSSKASSMPMSLTK